MTAAPSAVVVSVSIGVVFDEYPEEIGILLSCDGVVIVEFPAGSFEGLASQAVFDTYDVPRGATCTFSITDIFGDGFLCFGEDECGAYAVLYGNDTSIDANYIALHLFEDDEDVITFVAAGAPLTHAPSLGPTMAPSTSFAPSGLPSTSMPTTTASPSFDAVAVTVSVRFDEFPSETGIQLSCGGESLIDLPVLSFGEELVLTSFQETVLVRASSQCIFLLTDSFGDGLCARFSECGSYELYVGDTLIDSGSEFTYQVEVRFPASIAQAPSATTPTPTTSPPVDSAAPSEMPVTITPAPVATPTESLTPVVAPTDAPVLITTPAPVATPTDPPIDPDSNAPTNAPSSAFVRSLSLAFPLFIGATAFLASL
jgi:hypothetical protein